ncbi:MAG: DUF3795 domain-containing protein [Clostridia bacterium]|nr:DUF3795 domain-containing protein [Clostridia bacterium]
MDKEKQISINEVLQNAEHMAFCGFDCGKCPMYRATVDNDAELKKALIERYSTKERRLTEEDIVCFGCKAEKRYVHPFCEQCAIRVCAKKRGLSYNCGECDAYPCAEIIKKIPEEGESRASMDAVNRAKAASKA